jgi:hypothetical protein
MAPFSILANRLEPASTGTIESYKWMMCKLMREAGQKARAGTIIVPSQIASKISKFNSSIFSYFTCLKGGSCEGRNKVVLDWWLVLSIAHCIAPVTVYLAQYLAVLLGRCTVYTACQIQNY